MPATIHFCHTCKKPVNQDDADFAREIMAEVKVTHLPPMCPGCAYSKARNYCGCGSGEYPEPIYDGRGIYLCKACDQCRKKRLAAFRPEIVNECYDQSDVDEPIEAY